MAKHEIKLPDMVTGKVDLSRIDPADTGGLTKEQGEEILQHDIERLGELHDRLYADRRRAVLLVLQGMDTSGKDGTIRHVMAGLSPLGCAVSAFKQPSEEERAHDFLWRVHRRVPSLGSIGIFNRSHYEDVLVVRVHGDIDKEEARSRLRAIRRFEQHLSHEGVAVVKCFLHISPAEQKQRILERLEEPRKNWKYSPSDLAERQRWPGYMEAYEDALQRTSTKHTPWFVIPSDHRWYRNLLVARVLVRTMESLDLHYPKVDVPEAVVPDIQWP